MSAALTLAQFPESLLAGDSLALVYSDAAYPPADGWAAQLTLVGPEQVLLEADVDPDNAAGFLFSIGSSVSAQWTPGAYAWALAVLHEDDDLRVTLARGALTVVADPATQTDPTDPRTFAEKKLAALEAELLTKRGATSYSLFGRTYSFESHEALLKAREVLRREVFAEQEARRRELGQPSQRTAYIRFGLD